MRKNHRLLWGLIFLVLLAGCQPTSVPDRKISIRIPSKEEFESRSGVRGKAAVSYSLLCFVVNVTGESIPTSNGVCEFNKGLRVGSVPAGGVLQVEVPLGKPLNFEVYGLLRTSSTETCPTGLEQDWKWPLNKVYNLGTTAGVTIEPPVDVVSVSITLPDSSDTLQSRLANSVACRGSEDPVVPSTVGRILPGGTVMAGLQFRSYSRATFQEETKELTGTQFKIRQWRAGVQP